MSTKHTISSTRKVVSHGTWAATMLMLLWQSAIASLNATTSQITAPILSQSLNNSLTMRWVTTTIMKSGRLAQTSITWITTTSLYRQAKSAI